MIAPQHMQGQPPATVPYPIYARERERRVKAEQELAWQRQLWKNDQLNPAHKLQLAAMKDAIQRGQTHDDQGRTRINLTTIAEQIGMSPDTISRGLKRFLAQCPGLLDVEERAEIQENGERWTRKYASLNPELLASPDQIQPIKPRAHGGQRFYCQKCGSDKVKIKKRVTIVCKCGHESLIDEITHDQEPAAPDDQAEGKNFDEQGRNLPGTIKPVSPPHVAQLDGDGENEDQADELADLEAAALLLLAIAGQADEHIEMSRRGEKKYYTVDRPLQAGDLLDHLRGGKARGALCQHEGDQARALCWDTDDAQRWELLEDAARALAGAGYFPLLEESPADRGGHLWIIYTDLVNASAARAAAQEIAPQLADLVEYWPGPQDAKRWNKVRLPGACYVRPGVNARCKIVAVATGEASTNTGKNEIDAPSAARLLLANQTPAGIVPPMASHNQGDQAEASTIRERQAFTVIAGGAGELPNSQDQDEQGRKMQHQAGQIDSAWYAKYNTPEGKRLWFVWTPAQLAAWWNEQHSIEELLPRERNGYGLASWRGERTPSVATNGETWADFGASARRDDGNPDTGDALELQQRLTGTPKPEVMRQAARELLQTARQALETAARAGQPVPAWLEQFITPAGREHYQRLAIQAGHQLPAPQIRASQEQQDQAEASAVERQTEQSSAPQTAPQQGGLTGFLFNPDDQGRKMQTKAEERQLKRPALAVPHSTPAPNIPICPPEPRIAALCEERGLTPAQPCEKCACPLQRDLEGDKVCVRCYPPKGYHLYSDVIDEVYPRRRRQF